MLVCQDLTLAAAADGQISTMLLFWSTVNRKKGSKGTPAYLQSCDANPDSQASEHDCKVQPFRTLPNISPATTVKRRTQTKALQLTCNLVMPIQTARPVGMKLTMAFQGWP